MSARSRDAGPLPESSALLLARDEASDRVGGPGGAAFGEITLLLSLHDHTRRGAEENRKYLMHRDPPTVECTQRYNTFDTIKLLLPPPPIQRYPGPLNRKGERNAGLTWAVVDVPRTECAVLEFGRCRSYRGRNESRISRSSLDSIVEKNRTIQLTMKSTVN